MAQQGKYAEEQIRAALAHRKSSFYEFMERIIDENSEDVRFFFHIDNLLLVLYEHHMNGKYISKTQACRFVPVGHTNTCKRYVEEAGERGFVKFETDKNNARRINVVPTDELISYVRSKLEAAIDEARELIGEVSDVKPLPKDNRPLAEYPKRSSRLQ